MRVQNLAPHTFPQTQPHGKHSEWLANFSAQQRRSLIEEDRHARDESFSVLIGAIGFGMLALLATLFAAWWWDML